MRRREGGFLLRLKIGQFLSFLLNSILFRPCFDYTPVDLNHEKNISTHRCGVYRVFLNLLGRCRGFHRACEAEHPLYSHR